MPVYEYQCVDCGGLDQRVGGLDDQTAICTQCGSLMLRLDEDVFQPYFDKKFDNTDELPDISPAAEEAGRQQSKLKPGQFSLKHSPTHNLSG